MNVVDLVPKTAQNLLEELFTTCSEFDGFVTDIEVVGALAMAQAYYANTLIEYTDE
ncbi:hypothetical protein N9281_01165 [bacterium]|nr:hypothetical protein [bacterium]